MDARPISELADIHAILEDLRTEKRMPETEDEIEFDRIREAGRGVYSNIVGDGSPVRDVAPPDTTKT